MNHSRSVPTPRFPSAFRLRTRLGDLWRRLTLPLPRPEGDELRRQTRLLKGILLMTMAGALLAVVLGVLFPPHAGWSLLSDAEYQITLVVAGLLLLFYAFSGQHYFTTAFALVALISLSIIVSTLPPNDSGYEPFLLTALIVPVIISGILLPARLTLLVLGLNGGAVLAVNALLADVYAPPMLWTPLTVLLLGGALLMTGTLHRRALEEERRRALAASEQRYRTIVTHTSQGIWLIDTQARTTFVNDSMARILGEPPAALLGRSGFEFVRPEDIEAMHAAFDRRTQGETEQGSEVTLRRRDNTLVTIRVTANPLTDETGQFIGALALVSDVTEEKARATQERELALERERVRLLRKFLGDVSHDLRTPLTLVKSSVELFHRAPDAERRAYHLQKLETQVGRMEALLNQLFDITRLEDSVVRFALRPRDVNTLVQAALSGTSEYVATHGHTVNVVSGSGVPPVLADELELLRAIEELLMNAATFMGRGGVIRVTTGSDAHGRVTISVQDRGIGIGADDLPHIFERFYRADQARSSTTGRMGLGLAIARRIVRAHHGDISVVTRLGEGSTFTITLPPAPTTAKPPPDAHLEGHKTS